MKDIVQQSHALLTNPLITRAKYIQELEHLSQTKEILVITWQRRSWKSSIVRDFIAGKNALYINKELDVYDEIPTGQELQDILDKRIVTNGLPDFVVVDETLAIQVTYILHDWNMSREIGNLEKIPFGFQKMVLSLTPWLTRHTNEKWILIQSILSRLID